MNKYLYNLVWALVPLALLSQDNLPTYLVKKSSSDIVISGTGSASQWSEAHVLTNFVYPWQSSSPPLTEFRALWTETHLYFLYRTEDNKIITPERGLGERDVIDSDRVEIFFKVDDEMNPYYPLEMDSKARYFDAKGTFYRNVDFEWDWPAEHIDIKASIQPNGYTVEGSFTFESLKDLGIYDDDGIIRAGLYRGEYSKKGNQETEVKWISWVIPDSEKPDFHIPSSFGLLKLIEK